MKFREKTLESGTKIILGKDENSNDKLMKEFKGKINLILHTAAPGSPFGVIDNFNPSKEDVYMSGALVAKYSQDWRDNQSNVAVNIFTGKNISKSKGLKPGTWNVKKSKTIIVKKEDILKIEQ